MNTLCKCSFFFLSSSEKEAVERLGLQENPSYISVTKEEDGPGFSSSSEVRRFSLDFIRLDAFVLQGLGSLAEDQRQLRGSNIIV